MSWLSRATLPRVPATPAGPLLWVAVLLAGAVGLAVMLVRLSMAPPAAELRELAIYFAVAGVATTAAGWLALRAAERWLHPSIRVKAFAGASIGTAVALLNVWIVARLMFVNTAHDLPLLVVLLVFSGTVTVVFSLAVASTLANRVAGIGAAIRELSAGGTVRPSRRLPRPRPGDEVARLAGEVDALAERLQQAAREQERLERERRELTAALSHDLRTPLASVRAMVEALDDGVVGEAAEVTRYHSTILRELERLNGMLDDLFELARIDAGAVELRRAPVLLQEVATDVVEAMRASAERAGQSLTAEVVGDPPPALIDGERTHRAVSNLVRNALEHAGDGATVAVTVEAGAGRVRLTVSDDGPGVPEVHLPHIWERFYRVDPARGGSMRTDGGSGLGLAIVRAMVELHGGAVSAERASEGGMRFALELPLDGPAGFAAPAVVAAAAAAARPR